MQLNPAAGEVSRNAGPPDERALTHTVHNEFNYQYYEEYKKLYQTASLLSHQLRQLSRNKQELWTKIGRLEKKTEEFKDDIRGQPPERKKRFRRAAEEIERRFQCQAERCNKCYGSEGSLQQHIKLKHPQLYQSKSQHRHSHSQRGSDEDFNN